MKRLTQLANELVYVGKRNQWVVDPRTYLPKYCDSPISKPIFLLGVQGGGLTLLSRMLRRHLHVVSVSGNHRYWSGADEMHTVLGPILAPALTGARYKVPWADHPVLKPPRSWTYACDELLPYYRKTSADANDALRQNLKRAIGMSLARHASDSETARFTDKSQVYTVRVSLLRKLLEDHTPYFVLLANNPYAASYRAALGKAGDMHRLRDVLSFDERLELCAQHWTNSMACALSDQADDLLVVRFEDLLQEPERTLKQVCDHVDLDFSPQMLPSEDDRVPFGSRFRDRWYPLDPGRALHYLEQMTAQDVDIVHQYAADIAGRLGYPKPGTGSVKPS